MPPSSVGQTTGTIVGAAVAPGIGAPVGALVGLLAGMLIQGKMDQAREKQERVDLGGQLANAPAAATPQPSGEIAGTPTRVWVDETLRDGRLIAGHFDVRAIP